MILGPGSQDPDTKLGVTALLVASLPMGILLTKRRAVDLCRVATCLCCRH